MDRMRAPLLGLVLIGILGLVAELLLMEHYDSRTQIIPLGVLGLGLLAWIALIWLPTRTTIRVFQAAMGTFVLAGLVGLWLHYQGNASFELEIAPSRRGLSLIWMALRGAVPTLAPGALVQLVLLGLLCGHRHPALRPGASTTKGEER